MGRGEASPAIGFGDESVSKSANGCVDPVASRDASPYGACCRRVRMGRGEASPAIGSRGERISKRANGCVNPVASWDASPYLVPFAA